MRPRYNANSVSKQEKGMDKSEIKQRLTYLCRLGRWKKLARLLEDGYRGMFVILRIVRDSPSEIVAGDLAKLMGVSTARIARALNTLEEKDYIERIPEKSDARKVVIRLTEEGAVALSAREKEIDAEVLPMTENLSDEELRTFFDLLLKLLG